MKKKFIIAVFIIILLLAGLVTSYIDSARVRNGVEPKYTLKIISEGGNKITYWGLGYKVIRYPAVSPKESFKSSLGVKYGSWFMNYELSNYKSIDIELFMEGKTVQVSRTRDIEFIINLLENSKYINEPCDGINTHKIKIGDEIYYLKESCLEIQKGRKQAKISDEDLVHLLKIIDDYNQTNVSINTEGQYQFVGTIIEAHDNSIIVEPEEGTNERKSSDKISMKITRPTSGVNDFYVKGNKVKITYNGVIMESYPAQISAINIELVV